MRLSLVTCIYGRRIQAIAQEGRAIHLSHRRQRRSISRFRMICSLLFEMTCLVPMFESCSYAVAVVVEAVMVMVGIGEDDQGILALGLGAFTPLTMGLGTGVMVRIGEVTIRTPEVMRRIRMEHIPTTAMGT